MPNFLEHFSIDELAENHVTVDWSIVEMIAIANVIDDRELSSAIIDFHNSISISPIGKTPEKFLESYNVFADSARVLHEKIYALLRESTEAPEL